jgi:uncharacterized Zn finger protein
MSKAEETFEEWFCGYCGTAQKKNTVYNKTSKHRITTCTECGAVIRFRVINMPTKTVVEAIASFNTTKLTDSQAGHKPYRKRKRRRRKVKK